MENMDYGAAHAGAMAGAMMVSLVITLVIVFAFYALMFWKLFQKAGHPGWASIVPIYNLVVLCKIAGKSPWLILLCLIPYIGALIFFIIVGLAVAKAFGQSTGFAIGLILLAPIFYAILGFGSATYQGAGNAPMPAVAA